MQYKNINEPTRVNKVIEGATNYELPNGSNISGIDLVSMKVDPPIRIMALIKAPSNENLLNPNVKLSLVSFSETF